MMTLKEFIQKFVCRNTLIRLWEPFNGGHKMLTDGETEVGMEWEIVGGEGWQAKYADREIIGVTDIFCETYREAVNIVLKV